MTIVNEWLQQCQSFLAALTDSVDPYPPPPYWLICNRGRPSVCLCLCHLFTAPNWIALRQVSSRLLACSTGGTVTILLWQSGASFTWKSSASGLHAVLAGMAMAGGQKGFWCCQNKKRGICKWPYCSTSEMPPPLPFHGTPPFFSYHIEALGFRCFQVRFLAVLQDLSGLLGALLYYFHWSERLLFWCYN